MYSMHKIVSTAKLSYGDVLFKGTLPECLDFAERLTEEGTGWPFNLTTNRGKVIKSYIGY